VYYYQSMLHSLSIFDPVETGEVKNEGRYLVGEYNLPVLLRYVEMNKKGRTAAKSPLRIY
jgi:hypothetical protein